MKKKKLIILCTIAGILLSAIIISIALHICNKPDFYVYNSAEKTIYVQNDGEVILKDVYAPSLVRENEITYLSMNGWPRIEKYNFLSEETTCICYLDELSYFLEDISYENIQNVEVLPGKGDKVSFIYNQRLYVYDTVMGEMKSIWKCEEVFADYPYMWVGNNQLLILDEVGIWDEGKLYLYNLSEDETKELAKSVSAFGYTQDEIVFGQKSYEGSWCEWSLQFMDLEQNITRETIQSTLLDIGELILSPAGAIYYTTSSDTQDNNIYQITGYFTHSKRVGKLQENEQLLGVVNEKTTVASTTLQSDALKETDEDAGENKTAFWSDKYVMSGEHRTNYAYENVVHAYEDRVFVKNACYRYNNGKYELENEDVLSFLPKEYRENSQYYKVDFCRDYLVYTVEGEEEDIQLVSLDLESMSVADNMKMDGSVFVFSTYENEFYYSYYGEPSGIYKYNCETKENELVCDLMEGMETPAIDGDGTIAFYIDPWWYDYETEEVVERKSGGFYMVEDGECTKIHEAVHPRRWYVNPMWEYYDKTGMYMWVEYSNFAVETVRIQKDGETDRIRLGYEGINFTPYEDFFVVVDDDGVMRQYRYEYAAYDMYAELGLFWDCEQEPFYVDSTNKLSKEEQEAGTVCWAVKKEDNCIWMFFININQPDKLIVRKCDIKEQTISYEIEMHTYPDESVSILYPQLVGMKDAEKMDRINALIYKEIEKYVDAGKEGIDTEYGYEFSAYWDCEVKRADEQILSLYFSGASGVFTEGRGINSYAFAINIDLEKEEVISIHEFIEDLETLSEMLLNDKFEHITLWDGQAGNWWMSFEYENHEEELLENMMNTEFNYDHYVDWYITGEQFVFVSQKTLYYNEYAIDIGRVKKLICEEYTEKLTRK